MSNVKGTKRTPETKARMAAAQKRRWDRYRAQLDHQRAFLTKRFRQHSANAGKAGNAFLLTFEEWLSIWEASGHLHERGLQRGQYVMARHGDVGPYAVGNVEIITTEENVRAAAKGRRHSPSALAKLSFAAHNRTPETRAKISEAARKRGAHTEEHNRKIAASLRATAALRRSG